MEYDDLDRLLTVTSPMYSATSPPGTMTFGYDVLDNITSVRAWNRTLKYCYDDGTNRLTMIRSPWNTSCTTGAATTALAYDVQGNVSSKNNTTYEFDFGNRLRSATDGTTSTTYVYDAAGRRVRDITGSSRYSLYTQAGQVAYTSDARKREATNYIYLAGSLVATSRLPTGASTPIVEYQHTDALGTPVVVTNASRGIVQKSEYEPYGSVVNRPKTDGIGFTGHVEDGATGLTYMQQRYYDAGVGRFLSVDPVSADGASGANFNRYKYANNNPYRFTDPDGRLEFAAAGAGAGCAVSGPACPAGAAVGGGIGLLVDGAVLLLGGYLIYQASQGETEVGTAVANPDGTVTGADGEPIKTSSNGPRAGKRFKPETPEEKKANDGKPCVYCGRKTTNEPGKPESRQRDHGTAKAKGGDGAPDNVNNSCAQCNNEKGVKDVWEWVKSKFGGS